MEQQADQGQQTQQAQTEQQTTQQTQTQQTQQQTAQQTAASQSVASGSEVQQEKPYWPGDWREKIAEHASAGDKKIYEKELKRLQNMDSPLSVYGSFRNMENTWSSRKFVKLPGEDAKPEEVAEFHKGIGVPEKSEDYAKAVKLDNGAVIGDADKPMVNTFFEIAHKAGTPASSVNALLNWYFANQEKAAADLDEGDEKFKIDSDRALKDEFGPAFRRKIGSIESLFAKAPGGNDLKNAKSLYSRLIGGRTTDGKIIGNDPDVLRWLVSISGEVFPAASVVEDGDQSGQSLETEISKIEGIMRTNRREYDQKYAARYGELLAAREKVQARKRA